MRDHNLLAAVGDVIGEERLARQAADRELVATVERQIERIDEYGNVIATRFLELEHRMRVAVSQYVDKLNLKNGERGPAGERGEKGATGEPGAIGWPGEAGKPGEAGPAGERGERGEKGDAGERGEKGEQGAAGIAQPWRHRRAYDANEQYFAGDVVAYDGGSWLALRDDPGALPGDGWACNCARGKAGKNGERGPKGERGEPGVPGAPGVGVDDVIEDGNALMFLLSDGRVKTFKFRSIAFEAA